MDRRSRRMPAALLFVLAAVGVIGSTLPGAAQPVDCAGLRRQIAAFERGGGRAASYMRSARRQQAEIDRTLAYRRSLGCDRQGFGIADAPADCSRIDAQIDRMNANMANLQQSAAQYAGDDTGERADLIQQYSAYCGERGQWAYAAPGGPYPSDEAQPPETGYRRMPLDPDDDGSDGHNAPPDQGPPADTARPDESGGTLGGPKAVCVKTCDGSFFPVSFSASRDDLASLDALCHASCPNAETKLFTYDMYSEITQAVDREGASYAALPNALRYSKTTTPACNCRAPGKSWLDTLAEAERLYAGDKHDVVVTQQMSDALAQAVPASVSQPKPRKPRTAGRRKGSPQAPSPSAADSTDDATARDAKAAAGVPTASHESAGIDVGQAGIGGPHGTGEGATREIAGPDGRKRRVRVIAPDL